MFRKLLVVCALLLCSLLSDLTFAQSNQVSQLKPIAITRVTVIDATGSSARADMTVVVSGRRIVAIGKTGKFRVPSDAQTIDGGGKYLIPGLWDMHVHLSSYADTNEAPFTAFPALVTNGVTGVRDLGGDFEQIVKWRKAIADGALIGPRIFTAGPFVDGPKKMNETRAARTIVVKNAEEARAAVKKLKRLGVDCIKAHNGLSREAYLALVDESRKQKVLLATHLPTSVRVTEASDAGTTSIEHIEMLTESIVYDVPPGEKPQKDPVQALDELTDEKASAIFARFANNRTWYDPVLVAYYTFFQEAEENVVKDPRWKSAVEGRGKMFNRFKQFVGMMQRAGVGILAGTDSSRKRGLLPYPVPEAGTDLHKELEFFVEGGMTPLEALQTATLNPAKWLHIQKDYGTVEKGKIADLVLLDANPLDDIKNTRRIEAVVLNGRYLSKRSSTKAAR